MAPLPEPVIRGDFQFSFGRFETKVGGFSRVDGDMLRSMYIPKLTREASSRFRGYSTVNFNEAQLMHYGVDYDKDQFRHGQKGTLYFKKLLAAGKCDKVPAHMKQLRAEMEAEWWDKMSVATMAQYDPEQFVKRYFLDEGGDSNPSKTTSVLAVPFPYPGYTVSQITDPLKKVVGLHQARGTYSTEMEHGGLFVGWDKAAVDKAAADQCEAAEQERIQEEQERRDGLAARHKEYLKSRGKSAKAMTPVGSYVVTCEDLDDDDQELTVDIFEGEKPGIYEANFDFGVLEGAMVLGAQEGSVEGYCEWLEKNGSSEDYDEDEEEDEEDEEDDDEDDTGGRGTKKRRAPSKPPAKRGRGRPPKKAKATTETQRLFLRWRGAETSEGVIQYTAEEGSITFDSKYAGFSGEADLNFVGRNVPFTALKMSNEPSSSRSSWNEYSERAYEKARVGRWR